MAPWLKHKQMIIFHRLSDWYHKGTFYNAHNFCIHRYRCRKTNVCRKIILCDVKCASCPTSLEEWTVSNSVQWSGESAWKSVYILPWKTARSLICVLWHLRGLNFTLRFRSIFLAVKSYPVGCEPDRKPHQFHTTGKPFRKNTLCSCTGNIRCVGLNSTGSMIKMWKSEFHPDSRFCESVNGWQRLWVWWSWCPWDRHKRHREDEPLLLWPHAQRPEG